MMIAIILDQVSGVSYIQFGAGLAGGALVGAPLLLMLARQKTLDGSSTRPLSC